MIWRSLPSFGLRCFKHVRPLVFRSFDVGFSSGVVHNFSFCRTVRTSSIRVCVHVRVSECGKVSSNNKYPGERESRKIRRKLGK